MTFGEKLQKLRRAKGLSQEELAHMLSVARQTISKWELSQSTPELEYIAKLSDIYGVTTDYMIKPDWKDPLEKSDGSVPTVPAAASNTGSEQRRIRYSALFTLGLAVACLGMIGIAAFVIASAIDPVIYATTYETYRGVAAYLLYTDTLIWFILLAVMVMVGIAASIVGIFLRHKTE